jgi:gluconate kinase
MLGRKKHFFKATMLDSQLATLEEPTDAEGADNHAVLKLGKEGNEDEEVEEVELHAKAQEIVEGFLARNSSSLL